MSEAARCCWPSTRRSYVDPELFSSLGRCASLTHLLKPSTPNAHPPTKKIEERDSVQGSGFGRSALDGHWGGCKTHTWGMSEAARCCCPSTLPPSSDRNSAPRKPKDAHAPLGTNPSSWYKKTSHLKLLCRFWYVPDSGVSVQGRLPKDTWGMSEAARCCCPSTLPSSSDRNSVAAASLQLRQTRGYEA